MVYAIILAGGVGQRMHSNVPKQFLTINDKPVIVYTMEKFEKNPMIDKIVVACLENWEDVLRAYAKQFNITKFFKVVKGGINGQQSIYNAKESLQGIAKDDDVILIHDGIRPNVGQDLITDAITVCLKYGNSTCVVPCQEAMLNIEEKDQDFSNRMTERSLLKKTQTPHCIKYGELNKIHEIAKEMNITNSIATCTLIIETGGIVHFCNGSEKNVKLTTQDDIDIFKALLKVQNN